MGYLLTFGVLTFQIAIFVTIISASKAGKKSLNLATLGWLGFTLFGSIFTAGLLLFQLATIAIAYGIGRRRNPSVQIRAPDSTPKKISNGNGWVIAAVLIIFGVVAGKFLGRESAEADLERLRHIRAAREAAKVAPTVVPSYPPKTSAQEWRNNRDRARVDAQNEEAKRRLLERTPNL